MKFLAVLALIALFSNVAQADVLDEADGRWRGAGTGHDFDGVERDIRCRLNVLSTQSGRVDLRGVCAGAEGSRDFKFFVRNPSDAGPLEGGRLSPSGKEVRPFFKGTESPSELMLQGRYGESEISILIRREEGRLRMISTRVRAGRTERSDVLYQRP